MATETRQVASFKLSDSEKDSGFENLSRNPNVTITGTHDGLTREGEPVRVVDYIEKIGQPYYKLPIS